jgi:SAM-dependent methyltransferase
MAVKFSDDELASFKDKDSRVDCYRELYEKHDFLTAYAKHTDLRVTDDPHGGIGRADEWESHGALQLSFLISIGLKPEHTLLDVGCGTGRGARKFVPYLNATNYVGVDISEKALEHARSLSQTEGWSVKNPEFILNGDLNLARKFDIIWAHSVCNHLPDEQIEIMVCNAAKIMKDGAVFALTYKLNETLTIRTGLKQWKRDPSFFDKLAQLYGLVGNTHEKLWPAKQRTYIFSNPAYSSM